MPVLDTLCLFSIGCACPQYAVCPPIPCSCLQYVVPVLNTLCPSSIRCACPKYPVLVLDTLCLCSIGCACPRYAVPVLNTLSLPFSVPVPFRNRILTLIQLYRYRPETVNLISNLTFLLPWSVFVWMSWYSQTFASNNGLSSKHRDLVMAPVTNIKECIFGRESALINCLVTADTYKHCILTFVKWTPFHSKN